MALRAKKLTDQIKWGPTPTRQGKKDILDLYIIFVCWFLPFHLSYSQSQCKQCGYLTSLLTEFLLLFLVSYLFSRCWLLDCCCCVWCGRRQWCFGYLRHHFGYNWIVWMVETFIVGCYKTAARWPTHSRRMPWIELSTYDSIYRESQQWRIVWCGKFGVQFNFANCLQEFFAWRRFLLEQASAIRTRKSYESANAFWSNWEEFGECTHIAQSLRFHSSISI